MIGPVVIGAHAIVYVNSRPYARVFSISFQQGEAQREVFACDSLEPAEEVPGAVTARCTLQVYRLHGDGGAEGGGLAVPRRDLAVQKYCSILVADRVKDLVLFRADRAKLTQQGWSVPTKGMVSGSLTLNLLDLGNETEAAT